MRHKWKAVDIHPR